MRLAKWGNSLGLRLPRSLVREMGLKPGDEVTLLQIGERDLALSRDQEREQALERIKALSRPLPPDYRFDRDEIYDRFGPDSPGRKPYDDQ